MKIFILTLFILVPVSVQAFDFHGIKSGMSNKQVSTELTKFGISQDKNNQVDLITGDTKNMKGVKHSPIMIYFTYNDKDQLYKMQINYHGDFSTPSGLGLKLALEQLYKTDVKETEIKFYDTIRVESLAIILINKSIVESTINRYKNKYLEEL